MAERPEVCWVDSEDERTPPPGVVYVRVVELPPRYPWQDGTHTFPGGGLGGTDLIAAYVEVALVVTAADGRRWTAIHDPRASDGPLLPPGAPAYLRAVVHRAWKRRNLPGPTPGLGRDYKGEAIAAIRELRDTGTPNPTQEAVAARMGCDPRSLREDRSGASWADLLKEAAGS